MEAEPVMTGAALPIDWNEWRAEWTAWLAAHEADLAPTKERFPGKNFLADEVLGTWKVGGRLVELSEVTFPDFGDRTGHRQVRAIGITYGIGVDSSGVVVHSFAELESELGLTS